MVRPIELAPIHLSLDEVAGRADHKVLMVVDLYFTDCWWSTRDFWPAANAHPIYLLNIVILLISYIVILISY